MDHRGLVIASAHVLAGREPVRVVSHYADGSWCVLCDTTTDPADLVTVHAEHVFARFPELEPLRTLPPGWSWVREDPGAPWRRELLLDLM